MVDRVVERMQRIDTLTCQVCVFIVSTSAVSTFGAVLWGARWGTWEWVWPEATTFVASSCLFLRLLSRVVIYDSETTQAGAEE